MRAAPVLNPQFSDAQISELKSLLLKVADSARKDPSLRPNKTRSQRAFDSASAFHIAACRCFESEKIGEDRVQSPMMAGVVNLAFAIELYIKSRLVAKSRSTKKHNLSALYEELDQIFTDELLIQFVICSGRTAEALNEIVRNCSDYFVKFRYIHELDQKDNVIMIDVAQLACSLFRTITKLHPEWNRSLENETLLAHIRGDWPLIAIVFGDGSTFRVRPSLITNNSTNKASAHG